MRRVAVVMALLCVLTVTASAAYIPEDVVSENRDGRQLIIKTFTLSPGDDPSQLVEGPFELEGYSYHHLETVKQEQTFQDSRMQTETVTVETDTDDLSAILEQLAPSMEYSKDGYSGTLTLDHTTLQTEAAGYTTKYYTISDTQEFTGLDQNDPSYVPTTTVKNGSTLKLSNITWAVTGTGLADDTLVPTSYTATATYTATGSRSVATGYVTTASYVGEVTAEGIESVEYTVTYLGTPVEPTFTFEPMWLAMASLKPQTAAWSIFAETPTARDDTVLKQTPVSEPLVEFTFGESSVSQPAEPEPATPFPFPAVQRSAPPPAKHRSRTAQISEDQILLFKIA